jgi:hypothetical protein
VSNNFNQIPAELRAFRQWIVWRLEKTKDGKLTKTPYNPHNGKLASVTDPQTWADYDGVMLVKSAYSGIGFVLTAQDPYTCIDLDYSEDPLVIKRQIEIYEMFNSYTEWSQSGKGVHIWIKGHIESGRKRGGIEVYSELHYMAMTGDIYRDAPIEMRQDQLIGLWEQMGGTATVAPPYQDEPERESDESVIEKASRAKNGEKFKLLFDGQWKEAGYESQSESDFALVDIIAFYSPNDAQVERIFYLSNLGKRKKAFRKGYLSDMIRDSRDTRLTPISDELRNSLNAQMAAACGVKPIAVENPYTVPPGLLGDIARFIYEAAPSPVPEIALAGAIGLMAGICGRAYNVSGTGLNQYIILLARTGFGKEAMATGISKLLNSIRLNVPDCMSFKGSNFASAPGLIKNLSESKTKSVVCILSEFGLLFGAMNGKYADANSIMLRRMILDLFIKSGQNCIFEKTVYSKKENDISSIASPALTLLCESTPEEYYKTLDENLISQGLLPRFVTIEYYGARPAFNVNHLNVQPSEDLKNRLASLCAQSLMLNARNHVASVDFDNAAKWALDDFRDYCFKQMPEPAKDVYDQIWSRAHIIASRLAGIVAVGCNEINPQVDACAANWGIGIIKASSHNLIKRFENEDIGEQSSESKQMKVIQRIIKEYLLADWSEINKKYPKIGSAKLHFEKIIPRKLIHQRIANDPAFKKDRLGPTKALERTLQTLESNGDIKPALGAAHGYGGKCYFPLNLG